MRRPRTARQKTPYGTVVQCIELEVGDESMSWEIIHPFAYIWYPSSICPAFAQVMATSAANAGARQPLDLVLYGDELTPSNPLRVYGGRQAFCAYYCFTNWPQWLLHRKDGWLCLGYLRTSLIHRVNGSVPIVIRDPILRQWVGELHAGN